MDSAAVGARGLRAAHGGGACSGAALRAHSISQMSHLPPVLMLLALGLVLLTGVPVAIGLIGVSFAFAAVGVAMGAVRLEEMGAIYHRIYGTLSDRDDVLYAAVPILLFMGAVLHESGLAQN